MKKLYPFILSLFFSIVVHYLLFISLESLFPGSFEEHKVTKQSKHVIKATVIEVGARVDIIKMPTQTLQELKKLEKSRSVVIPTKKRNEILLSLLQDIAKKKVALPKTKKADKPKVLLMAGNKLSEGVALVGRSGSPTQEKFHKYLDELPFHIKPFWKLPSYLKEQSFRCRIQINISSQGELLGHTIIQSSGSSEYDQLALRATKNAAPYPIPDAEIISSLQQGYIILGFPD